MSGTKQNHVLRLFTSTTLLLIMINEQKTVMAEIIRGSRASLATGRAQQGINDEVIVPNTLDPNEPTCEELREMWLFSKRQSRAAQISNEIPTFNKNPFAENVWEPYYPTTRSIGAVQRPRYRSEVMRPVFGRVVHKQPLAANTIGRQRAFEDMSQIYGAENRLVVGGNQRRKGQVRFAGGGGGAAAPQNLLIPQRGSFARLKELVWTERAKELQQQRKSEELAARAAILKGITTGENLDSRYRYQPQNQQLAALQHRPAASAFTSDFMMNDNNPRNFIKAPNILQSMFNDEFGGNSNTKSNRHQERLLPYQRQSKPNYASLTSEDYDSNESN